MKNQQRSKTEKKEEVKEVNKFVHHLKLSLKIENQNKSSQTNK